MQIYQTVEYRVKIDDYDFVKGFLKSKQIFKLRRGEPFPVP